MYGNEIARVLAHDNGYTVETKTKPRPPRKPSDGKNNYPTGVSESDPAPEHEWESSVANSKKEVLDRVSHAHEVHQTAKMKGQFRKLNEKK